MHRNRTGEQELTPREQAAIGYYNGIVAEGTDESMAFSYAVNAFPDCKRALQYVTDRPIARRAP